MNEGILQKKFIMVVCAVLIGQAQGLVNLRFISGRLWVLWLLLKFSACSTAITSLHFEYRSVTNFHHHQIIQ